MARNPFDKERHYLHAMQTPKFRTKDFTQVQSGTTTDGVRIQAFEGRNPALHPRLKHGLMVEAPGQPAVMVYGSYQNIHDIAETMKQPGGIENVAKSLRFPEGRQSQTYYLDEQPPPHSHVMPSQEEINRYGTAQAVFGKHEHDTALTDRTQEEIRAHKQHKRDIAESRHLHPSSNTAQEAIREELKPAAAASILGEAE